MGRKFLNGLDAVSRAVLKVGGVTPDAAGNVPVMTSTQGWNTAIADVDTSNSTTTAVNTAIVIPAGLTPGTYAVTGMLLATSAANTTGIQVGLSAAAGCVPALIWQNPSSATAMAYAIDRAGGGFQSATASPYSGGNPHPIMVDGFLVVTTTTTAAMTVQVRSEIAASAVTVKARSFLSWRKVEAGAAGSVTLDAMPPNTALTTSGTTRPTARTDVIVIFTGADPGANALNGDVLLGT